MYRLRVMVNLGLFETALGAVNCLWGVRDERALGLLVFIAGIIFLATALVGQAVVRELRHGQP
jgi:hypothetical protein